MYLTSLGVFRAPGTWLPSVHPAATLLWPSGAVRPHHDEPSTRLVSCACGPPLPAAGLQNRLVGSVTCPGVRAWRAGVVSGTQLRADGRPVAGPGHTDLPLPAARPTVRPKQLCLLIGCCVVIGRIPSNPLVIGDFMPCVTLTLATSQTPHCDWQVAVSVAPRG